jgi:hypothetical protein
MKLALFYMLVCHTRRYCDKVWPLYTADQYSSAAIELKTVVLLRLQVVDISLPL